MIWLGCFSVFSMALLAINRVLTRKADTVGVCPGSARVTERTGARYEVLQQNHVLLGTLEGVLDGRRSLLTEIGPRDRGGYAAEDGDLRETLWPAMALADNRLAEAQAEWDRGVAAFHRLSSGSRSE